MSQRVCWPNFKNFSSNVSRYLGEEQAHWVEASRVRHHNPPPCGEDLERFASCRSYCEWAQVDVSVFKNCAPRNMTISWCFTRFHVHEGDAVEVSFHPEEEPASVNVCSWWEGVVVKAKGDFYVVEFPDEGCYVQEVVEKDRLRYIIHTRLKHKHHVVDLARVHAAFLELGCCCTKLAVCHIAKCIGALSAIDLHALQTTFAGCWL